VVQHPELEAIHDRYMTCLRHFTEYNFPAHPNRVQDLLVKLPEVRHPPNTTIRTHAAKYGRIRVIYLYSVLWPIIPVALGDPDPEFLPTVPDTDLYMSLIS
jgi:hypothetical protein